jgi:Zn-dependent peptidase ImmA (M78 family)
MISRQIIEKEANLLLEKFDLKVIPIDIEKLAEKLGLNIYKELLPEDISGILDLRTLPIIMVNKEHHIHRQRFSIAHEIGHYVLHKPKRIHVDKQTFYRNYKSSEGLDEIEIDANRFAAAILMPTELVNFQLNQYVDFIDSNEDVVLKLSKLFEVSATSISFRFLNLGYHL